MKEIFSRVSVRKYLDKPVEEEKIEKLLRAAMAAPSAGNQQPWAFCVVRDKVLLRQLVAVSPYTTPITTAPLVIAILSGKDNLRHAAYVDQDLAACTQNLLLEAEALELGAVWMGIAPLQDRMDGVKAILSLPDKYEAFALVSVGYPAEKRAWTDRYDLSRVLWK